MHDPNPTRPAKQPAAESPSTEAKPEPSQGPGTRFMEERYIGIQKILTHRFRHPHADGRGRLVTAEEIANRLGVTVPTVHRDMRELINGRGLPIEPVRGAKGGYRLTEDITAFPDLQLSSAELYFLVFGVRALVTVRGTDSEKTMRSLLEKLSATLDEGMTVDLKRLEELVTFRPGGYEAPVDLEVFDSVLRGLLDQEELTFTHTKADPDAKPQHRHVQPRHLATIHNNWYLFTDDPTSDQVEDQRTFALTRVEEVKTTGKQFTPYAPFDLEERLNGSIGVHTGGVRQPVRLHFSRKIQTIILERDWHPDQTLTLLEDGRVEMTFSAPVNEELMRFVLNWGSDVKVVEPVGLRDGVVAEARRVLAEADDA